MLVVNFLCIMLLYRFFGKIGLFVWIPVACILANIQVLKFVELFGLTATLGNIVYSTSFLVTDILNENYGKKMANKAVILGFISIIAMTVLMKLAIAFDPLPINDFYIYIAEIFNVMPLIAIASLTSFIISQLFDVWIYNVWRNWKPATSFIWLRNNFSTLLSQLIDTLIFHLIAFYTLLNKDQIGIWLTIVLTTYLFKLLVSLSDTPLVYLASYWYRNSRIKETSEETDL